MNPDATTYEELVATCRELSISESEIEQLFVRMVFNVMANNTDDHNKNFSFLLEENGRWQIAPAYDITFIFNTNGTGPNTARRLSVGGKTSDISKSDLLDFAKQNGIRNANAIINRVAEAIGQFNKYADLCGITQPWRAIIQKTLNDNLTAFGYLDTDESSKPTFEDRYGRTVSDFSISVNSQCHYKVKATINGQLHRRFVRPGKAIYHHLANLNIHNPSVEDKLELVETLFPPE